MSLWCDWSKNTDRWYDCPTWNLMCRDGGNIGGATILQFSKRSFKWRVLGSDHDELQRGEATTLKKAVAALEPHLPFTGHQRIEYGRWKTRDGIV